MNKYAIILIGFIHFLAGCHKPCHEPDYTFKVSEIFSPDKDSIQIGDTLWIQSSILKLQKDVTTQNEIDFSNAENLGASFLIQDISKFRNSFRGAIDSFEFFNIYGNIFSAINTDTSRVKQLRYSETDSSYQIKVGVVALKAGLYLFTIPDAPDIYRKNKVKCGIGDFEILNSNANKHLYLFENIWGPLSSYDSSHSYCVKVN